MTAELRAGAGRVAVAQEAIWRDGPSKAWGLLPRLDDLVRQRGGYSDRRRKVVSDLTRQHYRDGLRVLFALLADAPDKPGCPTQFDARHLQFLYRQLAERQRLGLECGQGGWSKGTVDNYRSYLKTFLGWIGQPQMEKLSGVRYVAPQGVRPRQTAASHDKSWEGAGLDVGAKIDEVAQIARWVAMTLLAQHAFGLRRKEAVCFRPAKDAMDEGVITITRGSKGGRPRIILLQSPWQFEVLALLRVWVAKEHSRDAPLGGAKDLKASLGVYARTLAKVGLTRDELGVTGHGLRAGFACRMLEGFGVTPPVRREAGAHDVGLSDEERSRAYRATSEALGHSRERIVGAYVGSLQSVAAPTPLASPPDMGKLTASVEHLVHRVIDEERRQNRLLGQAVAKAERRRAAAFGAAASLHGA